MADPCLYYKWTHDGLVTWITWVDDCLVVCHPEQVKLAQQELTSRFDCNVSGSMAEYVGCKLDCGDSYLKFTQPVMVQSFVDEFVVNHWKPSTPAKPGSTLRQCNAKSIQIRSKETPAHDAVE